MEQEGLINATQMPMAADNMAHDLYVDKLFSKFPSTDRIMKHRMVFKLYSLATFGEIRPVNSRSLANRKFAKLCYFMTL